MSRYTNTDNNNAMGNSITSTITSIATALVVFTKKKKHRLPYVFYGSIGFIIIIYCLYYLSLTSSSFSSKKDTSQVKPNQVHVDYMDTSQMMNNVELQRLLFQDVIDAGSVIPKTRKYGHSEQQLKDMIQADTTLPTITALLQATPTAQFYAQLSAILHQSTPPSTVWLVCHSIQHQTVLEQHIQSLPEKPTIHLLLLQPADDASWMTFALQADSDYIWIIERDAMPGKGYLKRLIQLSSTTEYRHNFLGTLGYDEQDGCIESTDPDFVTRPVNRLGGGLWLLHRSWLALDLFRPSLKDRGRLISDYLDHIGITPVVLPCLHPSQWHDVNQVKTNTVCPQLQQQQQQDQDQEVVVEPSDAPSLAFLVDEMEQLQELAPLICHRSSDRTIHVLSTQPSSTTIQTRLIEYDPQCTSIVLHDPSEWSLHGNQQPWQLAQTLLEQLPVTLEKLGATVLIHTLRPTHPLPQSLTTLDTTWSKITTIGLPARDIQHVQWMMDLPMMALKNWHIPNIELVVTTDRNPYGLTRLLRSATKAHLMGDTVDLTVVIDQSSDRVTQRFVNDFTWIGGNKNLRHRIVKVNRMPLFVESWYPKNSANDYAILLSDDLDVSPLFYIWAKRVLLQYRYSGQENEMVMGISLYTPRLVDNDPAGRRLLGAIYSPFLMQTVTNGGTLVFPEHWREFHDYVTARYADIRKKQLQTIDVPGARSAGWINSWRKYLDELMYLRGYVVVYPQHSFSTQYLELPHHMTTTKSGGGDVTVMDDSIRGLFKVPMEQDKVVGLPTTIEWYDLWGKQASHEEMVERGHNFQTQISACPPPTQYLYDPADLLCPFARIVDVPMEEATVDILPTRIATLYVTSAPTPTPM